MSESCPHTTIATGPGRPRQGFVRSRLHNFGLTMVVMGASFVLYYLGLFGTVDGPLTPANLGASLANLGVTQRHMIVLLLSLLIGAVSWNWLYNLTSLAVGSRMTCKARGKDERGTCGAPVRRTRRVSKRTGGTMVQYVCPCGHRRPDADFHPIKKGTASNTVWIACLVFLVIAFFGR